MSNRAQAQYIRIYTSGGSDHYLWQNYYVNSTVSWNSKNWDYFPFEFGGITETAAIGGTNVSFQLPATDTAVTALQAALFNRHLCEVRVYEFDNRLGNDGPQSGQTLIVDFLGEIRNMSGSFIGLDVELGTALAPVGAQIPPRTYTSRLVGNPIRI